MSPHDLDEKGNVRWPFALPMVRAWRFPTKPLVLEVLRKQLPYNATSQAVLLEDEDAIAVNALPVEEAELPSFPKMDEARRLIEALAPTRGPTPTSASYGVRTTQKAAFTYCFRFGAHDVWKIGWADDVRERLREVNRHVPNEVTGTAWTVALHQGWDDQRRAHQMEQRLFELLERFRTTGERVSCPQKELQRAWTLAIGG